MPERTATLRITYQELDNGTGTPKTHWRDVEIRQAGMVPVTMPALNGKYGEYTFYIESYEEYLEHYDGKDRYTHTYDGLPWGLTGLITGLGETDIDEFMPYGWRNTMTIMQQFRLNDSQGQQQPDITLNDTPRSAAEYCYNKNMRNTDGKVVECRWYFPTIREIEQAIDQYYSYADFNGVFQENWYWGSNPGPGQDAGNAWNNPTSTGESTTYARATKSVYQNVNGAWGYSHATSEANKPYDKDPNNMSSNGWDTWFRDGTNGINMFDNPNNENLPDGDHGGMGGFARRNKIFRIRAAYIYHVPEKENRNDYDVPGIDNEPYLRSIHD